MTEVSRTAIPGVGLDRDKYDFFAYNRCGASLVPGTLVATDVAQTHETANDIDGDPLSVDANVMLPSVQSTMRYGRCAIALEATADNAVGKFRLWGVVDALVIKASGSVVVGDPIAYEKTVTNVATSVCDAFMVAGDRVIGRALEAKATPTTAVLTQIEFNGLRGFGTYSDA